MASTPPPRTTIPVPPTPRHGAGLDTYGRFSSRRSERLAGRTSTPGSCSSPESGSPRTRVGKPEQHSQRELRNDGASPTSRSPPHGSSQRIEPDEVTCSAGVEPSRHSPSRNTTEEHNSSTFSSPTAPASATTLTTSQYPSHDTMDNQDQQTNMTAGMLPTPVKTPQKNAVSTAGLDRRSLFPTGTRTRRSEELSPKKDQGKNFSHFSLESFNSDPQAHERSQFEVFTDSRDRIPKANQSMDNPFLSKATAPEMSMDGAGDSSKKRRKVDSGRSNRDSQVDDAVRRDDGLLYVFRGRKVFREFKPESEGESDSTDQGLLSTRHDLDDVSSPPRVRPLTRSSVKPRVLFPNATKSASGQPNDSNNNNTTVQGGEVGIQRVHDSDHHMEAPHVPSAIDEEPVTPSAKFVEPDTPSTPISGGRFLRSNARKEETARQITPREAGPAPKRFSPFDRWRRTKGQSTPTKTKRTNATVSEDSGGERETKKLRGE